MCLLERRTYYKAAFSFIMETNVEGVRKASEYSSVIDAGTASVSNVVSSVGVASTKHRITLEDQDR